jgi:hypothetical protein
MVTQSASARSDSSKSTRCTSEPRNPLPRRNARQWPSDDRRLSSQDLDYAIGQLASGLRVLLNLGLSIEDDTLGTRSDDMSTESSSTTTADRYDVFVVENYEDGAGTEKSNWMRIGVAFPHKDENGLNVELRAIPVNGKLVIRRHEVKPKATAS